ncbi:MAG TPA: TetR family transcriptional regulator [Isosphaeraceae bacterium]|nr:TetR family transcriptional regulator [Isosphaeraceae bacterium]
MEAASVRREHLLETALELFYKNGFHATGIDTILAESGVAKMTLYKYFKSKDDLIFAALELRDQRWMSWFGEELKRRGKTPQQRLLAVFDVLGDWFRQKEFRGCLFINAASEYCGLDRSIGDLAARHKRLVREQLHKLTEAAGVKQPADLADQLSLLVEGAIVMALMEKSPDWALTAREAARVLIKSALPTGSNAATK